jgi:hypothetical protein
VAIDVERIGVEQLAEPVLGPELGREARCPRSISMRSITWSNSLSA